MTDLDLDDIEAKARAATPGPWRHIHPTDSGAQWVGIAPEFHAGVLVRDDHATALHFDGRAAANAELIAALDPTTALALVARARALPTDPMVWMPDYDGFTKECYSCTACDGCGHKDDCSWLAAQP